MGGPARFSLTRELLPSSARSLRIPWAYGAVSLALDSLGVPLSKTRVYEIVQAVAARIPGLKREQVFQGVKTTALGGDLTSVKCAGQWLHLGLTADSLSGLALTIDEVSAEDAATRNRLDRTHRTERGSPGVSDR